MPGTVARRWPADRRQNIRTRITPVSARPRVMCTPSMFQRGAPLAKKSMIWALPQSSSTSSALAQCSSTVVRS